MENTLNQASLKHEMPERLQRRPIGSNGFVIPWFVTARDRDGEPDFRPTEQKRAVEAIRKELCWVCGLKLGRYRSFAIGPMCAINRVTAEPPMHRECAEYSVKVCPFMAKPKAKRNTVAMHEGVKPGEHAPGIMLQRNPGVVMLWHAQKGGYRWFNTKVGGAGLLCRLEADPLGFDWYSEGRMATEDEVRHSVDTGLPHLWKLAKLDGPEAERDLGKQIAKADRQFFVMVPVITSGRFAAA